MIAKAVPELSGKLSAPEQVSVFCKAKFAVTRTFSHVIVAVLTRDTPLLM